MLLAPIGVVALIAAIVIPQLGHGGLRPGEAELNANGGRASVEPSSGGPAQEVTGATRVRTGDIVTAEYGQPSLDLPGGGELILRGADAGGDATSVKVASTSELRSGDLLATSKDHGYSLTADGTVIAVAANGAAVRLSRSNATVDVGVYQGQARIDSAGVGDTVHALRQVAVTGLRNVDQPYALPVDTSDAWDRQYLASAIDAQHLIDPLRTSFDGVVGSTPLTAAQLDQALPGLLPADALATRLGALPQNVDPGGVLVGATIVSLGTHGNAASRWDDVFSFHDDGGATWGLVAMDQGVTPAALNQALQDAVQRLLTATSNTPSLATPPAPAVVSGPASAPATSPSAGDASTPAPGSGGAPTTAAPSRAVTPPTLPASPQVQSPAVTLPSLPAPLPQLPALTGGGDQQSGGVLQPLLNTVGGLLNGLVR